MKLYFSVKAKTVWAHMRSFEAVTCTCRVLVTYDERNVATQIDEIVCQMHLRSAFPPPPQTE